VTEFDRFIGVDWSGAKNDTGKVYLAEVSPLGNGQLRLERVERSSRAKVEHELRSWSGQRALFGLDFAFSFPEAFRLGGATWTWPGLRAWCGELVAASDGDVRAALHAAVEREQFRLVAGDRAELLRRRTEQACDPVPSSVLNLVVYQRQVTLGTVHGIAMLDRLADMAGLAVWPFEPIDDAQVVAAEVYPAMWLDQGIRKSRPSDRRRQLKAWASCVKGLDSVEDLVLDSEDALDALAVALALPALRLEAPDDPLVAREGWILGVPLPDER
jgi:hypothetical protein